MIQTLAFAYAGLAALPSLMHLAIAAGAPLGRLTIGGRFHGRLPPAWRVLAVVQAALAELCDMVRRDAVAADVSAGGADSFVAWYDLTEQDAAARLHRWVEGREAAARARAPRSHDFAAADAAGTPTTADFHAIVQRLDNVRFADLIQQQLAVHVQPGAAARPVLAETYVSIAALRERLGLDADPAAHPWLFRDLTADLDRRMIEALCSGGLGFSDVPISLNVNIATLASRQFDELCEAPARLPGNTMFEINLLDALADLAGYRRASARLRNVGFGVLIDGIDPLALPYLDVGELDPDLLKLWWNDRILSGDGQVPALEDRLSGIDAERIILARVDTEVAVRWGMQRGVRRYQGRFIDGILRAEAGGSGLRDVSAGAR